MAELNLIPYELKKKGKQSLGPSLDANSKKYVKVFVIIFIILGIGLPIFGYSSLRIKEKALKREIDAGKAVLVESEKLAKYIQDCKNHIAVVESLSKTEQVVATTIRKLEKHMVGDIVFASLNYGEGIITIEANAKDYNSISTFVANIEESDEFKGSKISSITLEKEGGYTCSITVNYQEVVKGE